MRYRKTQLVGLALLGGLIGCGDSSGPADLKICTNPVTLTVSSGTTPTISWAPACLANQLVIQEQGGGPIWGVAFVVDSNRLRSPVQFGVAQSGAIGNPASPAALTAGTTYTFNLFIDPVGGQPVQVVGTTNVTP